MTGKVTTLFIEDTSIRLLLAKGKQVVSWASAPLEPGLVKGGVILDEAQVADKLKELFLQAKVSPGKVTAGLSGLNSLYRLITLPDLPEAILPEAVRHEADRVIPTSLDEVYLSYQTIPAPSGEVRAFVAAYPRKETDVLVSTLRRAGLKPNIMDLSPLAVCRVLNELKAIVVSARSACLDIIIMVDRVPQVIRNLPLPGETESLSENMAAITEELERTIAFYNSSHSEAPLDATVPIFVSGDLAEAPDLWQSLVGSLNCPVSALPSPMECPEGFPVNEFMVNIGLALKRVALEKEKAYYSLVNFNALPEIYQPERPRVGRILTPIGIVAGIGVLAFLGLLVRDAAAKTDSLRSQLGPLESLTAQHVEKTATLRNQITQKRAELPPSQATLASLQAKITSLKEGREQIYGDLDQIVRQRGNILLRTVSNSGSAATISATALRRDDIFKYARDLRLRDGGRFSEVVISSITYTIENDIERFDFTLQLK